MIFQSGVSMPIAWDLEALEVVAVVAEELVADRKHEPKRLHISETKYL